MIIKYIGKWRQTSRTFTDTVGIIIVHMNYLNKGNFGKRTEDRRLREKFFLLDCVNWRGLSLKSCYLTLNHSQQGGLARATIYVTSLFSPLHLPFLDRVSTKKSRNAQTCTMKKNDPQQMIKMDSVQSSSNYLQKSFTKNVLTAR